MYPKNYPRKKIIFHPEINHLGELEAIFVFINLQGKIRFSKNKIHILVITFQVTTRGI